MSNEAKAAHLTIHIGAVEDADADEIDRLARNLLAEIKDLEVESADLVREGEAPTGTKSAEVVTIGALAIAVLPAVVPKLVEFLKSWSLRAENRTVKIKTQRGDRSLEVEYSPASMSPEELKSLVDTLTGTMTGTMIESNQD